MSCLCQLNSKQQCHIFLDHGWIIPGIVHGCVVSRGAESLGVMSSVVEGEAEHLKDAIMRIPQMKSITGTNYFYF